MGAGYHGGFGNTYGAVAGDAVYKSKPLTYFEFISKRPVKDAGGVYDVVAHGESNAIQIEHNGTTMTLDSRALAKMLKNKKDYSRKQPIRLLSCNTGSDPSGFAQNLANKTRCRGRSPYQTCLGAAKRQIFCCSKKSQQS